MCVNLCPKNTWQSAFRRRKTWFSPTVRTQKVLRFVSPLRQKRHAQHIVRPGRKTLRGSKPVLRTTPLPAPVAQKRNSEPKVSLAQQRNSQLVPAAARIRSLLAAAVCYSVRTQQVLVVLAAVVVRCCCSTTDCSHTI